MSNFKSAVYPKILFLDIDGVLSTSTTMLSNPGSICFAPEAVAALEQIVKETDCHIVITSTRRRSGLDSIRQLFSSNGATVASTRIIDSTPLVVESDTDEFRADEILLWMDENRFSGSFAILDDGAVSGLPVIVTSHDRGLTARDAAKTISRLGRLAGHNEMAPSESPSQDRGHASSRL